jgi:predicted ABC-type ATPase
VQEGGHNVPEETVRRRFTSGLRNFEEMYKPIVDECALQVKTTDRYATIVLMLRSSGYMLELFQLMGVNPDSFDG